MSGYRVAKTLISLDALSEALHMPEGTVIRDIRINDDSVNTATVIIEHPDFEEMADGYPFKTFTYAITVHHEPGIAQRYESTWSIW